MVQQVIDRLSTSVERDSPGAPGVVAAQMFLKSSPDLTLARGGNCAEAPQET